ncbi:uncharacterized protein LOC118149769 isoform X2 [Callithrix jacchus]
MFPSCPALRKGLRLLQRGAHGPTQRLRPRSILIAGQQVPPRGAGLRSCGPPCSSPPTSAASCSVAPSPIDRPGARSAGARRGTGSQIQARPRRGTTEVAGARRPGSFKQTARAPRAGRAACAHVPAPPRPAPRLARPLRPRDSGRRRSPPAAVTAGHRRGAGGCGVPLAVAARCPPAPRGRRQGIARPSPAAAQGARGSGPSPRGLPPDGGAPEAPPPWPLSLARLPHPRPPSQTERGADLRSPGPLFKVKTSPTSALLDPEQGDADSAEGTRGSPCPSRQFGETCFMAQEYGLSCSPKMDDTNV